MNQLRSQGSHQHGIVLIAVLWIVAALAIIVTGLSQSVRGEARVASTSRQVVMGNAAADAAVALAVQDMASRTERPARLLYVDTTYHGISIRVQVTPLSGFIDINNAPAPLLATLFNVAGSLGTADAQRLAGIVVEARSQKDRRGVILGFEAPEDLLHVPGFSYDLYAKIAPLVTADLRSSGRVNPMAAPEDVLVVLAEGNLGRATKLAADRDAGVAGVDTTILNGAYIDTASSQRLRLVARVPLPDGGWLLASRTVDLGNGAEDGLPWRTLNAAYRFEAATGLRN